MALIRQFSRIRLATFLVVAVAIGATLGMLGRYYVQPIYSCIYFDARAGIGNSVPGIACWQSHRNSKARQLEYAVFFRSGDTHHGSRPVGYEMQFPEPGIISIGGLLYMNGNRVDVSDKSRVFVYTSLQTMESLDVTEEELKVIEEVGFDRLDETRLWHDKLWPKLQKYERIPVKDIEKKGSISPSTR